MSSVLLGSYEGPKECIKQEGIEGSGCGSVGKAVASGTRGPRFEFGLQQLLFTVNRLEKTKIKKKRRGMAH